MSEVKTVYKSVFGFAIVRRSWAILLIILSGCGSPPSKPTQPLLSPMPPSKFVIEPVGTAKIAYKLITNSVGHIEHHIKTDSVWEQYALIQSDDNMKSWAVLGTSVSNKVSTNFVLVNTWPSRFTNRVYAVFRADPLVIQMLRTNR